MTGNRSWLTLILFLLIVAAVAMSGVTFQPGEWYAGLAKPFWTPPDWLFPPVWTLLYIMIAVAGWLIFSTTDVRLKTLWVIQLILNALWSWLFFGQHRVAAGFIDILLMLACIGAIIALACRPQRTVAWLMAPYFLWVAYAASLNGTILLLN